MNPEPPHRAATDPGRPPDVLLLADNLGILGGVQRFAGTLAAGLAGRGLRVACVEIEGDGTIHGLPPDAAWPVHTLHPGGTRRLPYEPVTGWQRAKLAARGPRAWSALRRRERDARRLGALLAAAPAATVVLTQLRSAEYALAGLRQLPRADWPRLVLQYHDSCAAAERHGDLPRLRRLLQQAGEAAEFLVLSEGDAAAFAATLGRRPTVQRNPVDVAGLAAASGPADRPRDRLVVAGARYDAQKSLDVLLRAWALAVRSRPGWRLEVYGDGPHRPALSRLATELGLGRAVLLAPETDDYPARLQRAALSALSSRHEGMGLVLAEAAACAVPSVTTDAGPGVREVVGHGRTGLITPVGDVRALAAALGELMDDPARRAAMGAAARERMARFDREAVLGQWQRRITATAAPPDPAAPPAPGRDGPRQAAQWQAKGRPV